MKDQALNVLIVHGIGEQPIEFAQSFERALIDGVRHSLDRLRRTHSLKGSVPDKPLRLIPGRWAQVTGCMQKTVERRLFHHPVDFLRGFGMRLMGDVVAYQGRAVYNEIHRILAEDLRASLCPESGHLTVIAHSLGAVVASNFLYDHTLKIRRPLTRSFGVPFSNFFTLGSPMALYAMQTACRGSFDGDAVLDQFDQPVRVESETGVWVNVFDQADIIGYPIRSINRFYAEAVTADVATDVGDFWSRGSPLSHIRYWTHPHVIRLIADKLAVDLAERHLGLTGAPLRRALADYLQRLALPLAPRPALARRWHVMTRLARLAVG